MNVRDYYDTYAERQVRVGINDRHRAIQHWLLKFGLVPGMDVLEVGCGIGTQTELIARHLGRAGALVAIDLSPRNVELARRRMAPYENVEILEADVIELALDRKFDVVVLPDVIEHIPLELHGRLFVKVRDWLKDQGWVLIHIPNPLFTQWCQRNRPELLQIIDQPIFTERLLHDVAPTGLYLHYLKTYSIWVPECDYQVLVLRVRSEGRSFQLGERQPSMSEKIALTLRRALRLSGAKDDAKNGV